MNLKNLMVRELLEKLLVADVNVREHVWSLVRLYISRLVSPFHHLIALENKIWSKLSLLVCFDLLGKPDNNAGDHYAMD